MFGFPDYLDEIAALSACWVKNIVLNSNSLSVLDEKFKCAPFATLPT